MRAIWLGTLSALTAAMLVGAAAPQAWAAGISFNSLTPAQFISSCEQMGGTVSRPGAGTIRCKLPSGTVVDCSFGTGGTICTWKGNTTPPDVKHLFRDVPPASINPNPATPPKADGAPASVN